MDNLDEDSKIEKEKHKKQHLELHAKLDELLADWISHTKSMPSKSTVFELLEWSYEQTLSPTNHFDPPLRRNYE